MRTWSGRPSSSIRFSAATAIATSVARLPSVRDRSTRPAGSITTTAHQMLCYECPFACLPVVDLSTSTNSTAARDRLFPVSIRNSSAAKSGSSLSSRRIPAGTPCAVRTVMPTPKRSAAHTPDRPGVVRERRQRMPASSSDWRAACRNRHAQLQAAEDRHRRTAQLRRCASRGPAGRAAPHQTLPEQPS